MTPEQANQLALLTTRMDQFVGWWAEWGPKLERCVMVTVDLEAMFPVLKVKTEDTLRAGVRTERKAEEAMQKVDELARAAGAEAGHAAATALAKAQRKLYLASAAVLLALATAIPALVQHYTWQPQPAIPAESR